MAAILAVILAVSAHLGGNDGGSTHPSTSINSVPVHDVQAEARSVEPQGSQASRGRMEPSGTPDPIRREAGPAIHRITIHGLSGSGVAPPPPTATPTILPTPAKWSVTDIICSYSWPCEQAIAVARCESGLNPNARNATAVWLTVPGHGYVANHAQGLFQTLMPLHAWRYQGASAYDPAANTAVAYQLWRTSGWQPWRASIHCHGYW